MVDSDPEVAEERFLSEAETRTLKRRNTKKRGRRKTSDLNILLQGYHMGYLFFYSCILNHPGRHLGYCAFLLMFTFSIVDGLRKLKKKKFCFVCLKRFDGHDVDHPRHRLHDGVFFDLNLSMNANENENLLWNENP